MFIRRTRRVNKGFYDVSLWDLNKEGRFEFVDRYWLFLVCTNGDNKSDYCEWVKTVHSERGLVSVKDALIVLKDSDSPSEIIDFLERSYSNIEIAS